MTPLTTTSFRLSRCWPFTVVKTSFPLPACFNILPARLGWRERARARRTPAHPLKSRRTPGGRHIECEFAAPGARVRRFGGRMVSPPGQRGGSFTAVRLYHADHHIQPLRSQPLRLRQHRLCFSHARAGAEEIFNFRWGRGRCSNKRSDQDASGSSFISPVSLQRIQRQIKPSTIFLTRHRLPTVRASGLCVYSANQLRDLFNGEVGFTAATRGFGPCRGAGCQIIIQPALPTPSPAQPEPRNSPGLAARGAATRACI